MRAKPHAKVASIRGLRRLIDALFPPPLPERWGEKSKKNRFFFRSGNSVTPRGDRGEASPSP